MPDPQADYEVDIDWSEAEDVIDDLPEAVPVIPAKVDRDLAVIQGRAARRVSQENGEEAPAEDAVLEPTSVKQDRVRLLGREFRVSDRIGLMPLLKFSSAMEVSIQDPRALAAMYTLLRDCIYEGSPSCGKCDACMEEDEDDRASGKVTACPYYDRGDWGAFEEHAMVAKADAEDLFDVVNKVLEIVSGRPTPPRAGSSSGQRQTRRTSTGASSSRGARKGSRR